jgi:hypothetical protein
MQFPLRVESLDHSPDVTHLTQMLVQFRKELTKHMTHGPLLRTCGNLRGEGGPPRHDIEVLEGILVNVGALGGRVAR